MKSNILLRLMLGLCLCAITSLSYGQQLGFVYGHGQYHKTAGSFNNNYGWGIGGEIGAGIGHAGTYATLMTGYSYFNGINSTGAPNLKMQPIRAGLRHTLVKSLYIKADAGIARLSYSGTDGSTSKFSASGGVGLHLAGMELEADYAGVNGVAAKWFGFKAGFNIGF